MRVLIVDPNRTEREATARLLPRETHEVRSAQDACAALAILDAGEIDVVLVEWTMTGVSGGELLKRIRARESSTHVYIVVTAARPQAGDVKAAFLMGADDFIRKPLARDELLARVDGHARVRRWASRVLVSGGFDESSPRSDITSTSAWISLDAFVCSELSDMLGLSLSPVPAPDALDGAVTVAVLPLSLVSERVEVCVAVGIDGVSSAALAESVLGNANVEPEALHDVLREVANIAAGAFKRAALPEGRTFTTGLPVLIDPGAFRTRTAKARRQWVGAAAGSPICFRFEVELRAREAKHLRVAALREGMVVTTDIANHAGALLMASGTRITESALTGLARILGSQALLEIMEAD